MSESFLFLQRDYDALVSHVDSVMQGMKRVQGEAAESTEQSSETWHDNFMFEDGQRQMLLLSDRLSNLNGTLACAEVVEPRVDGVAGVGSCLEVVDETTGETRRIAIGSYLMLEQRSDVASYASPLGQLLFGSQVGEVREGMIGPTSRRFKILSVF